MKKPTTIKAPFDSLFTSLSDLRKRIAIEENIKPFMVVGNTTLVELISFLPLTREDIKRISGFGITKTHRYANRFLKVITAFCTEHSLETRIHLRGDKRIVRDIPASDNKSKRETFDLLKSGKTPKEISLIRVMDLKTIDKHISFYIRTGEISIYEIMSATTVTTIENTIERTGTKQLSNLKRMLGSKYSYSDIKYVLASIREMVAMLLLVALPYFAHSQDKKAILYASVNASFPVGDFADKNTDNDKSGLAEISLGGFEIGYARTFGDSPFGLAGMMRHNGYAVDKKQYEKYFTEEFGGSWDLSIDDWGLTSFYVGAYSSRALSKTIWFDSKLMGGVAIADFSNLSAHGVNASGNMLLHASGENALSATFMVGGGFKFDDGKKWVMLINIDYFQSKPEFKIKSTLSGPDGATSVDSMYEQPISAITLSFGVAYRMK